MNKKLEALDDFVNDLNEDTKKLIDIEPAFMYKGQIIRLDFIGKTDKLFLEKVFEEIEKDRNEKIDFDLLKREAKQQSEQEILDIQKNIARIQAQKFISSSELEILYPNMSKKTQAGYRGRINDPLPFQQKVEGGNITYEVEKVEQWLANQHK